MLNLTVKFLMWLVLFVQLIDFKCSEVLAHSKRNPASAVHLIFFSPPLLAYLFHDMSLYLVFVIPVDDRSSNTTHLACETVVVCSGCSEMTLPRCGLMI